MITENISETPSLGRPALRLPSGKRPDGVGWFDSKAVTDAAGLNLHYTYRARVSYQPHGPHRAAILLVV